MKKIGFYLLLSLFVVDSDLSAAAFLSDFPDMKKLVYAPTESPFLIGFGIVPLAVIKSKFGFSLELLELHYRTHFIDFEIVNAQFGMTLGSGSQSKTRSFQFRSSPKYRITKNISLGPLIGYEFVQFPDVQAQVHQVVNDQDLSANPTGFSSDGFIYGGDLSETLTMQSGWTLKASQVLYKQNYSTTSASNGWRYLFTQSNLNVDSSSIKAGLAFLLQFSLLY